MDYQLFQRLLEGGERDTVDFKIDSQAFATKTVGEKGELAKDICALANNGNRKSYLVIGVSDDRKHFKSFVNPKFTDDALQNFCKTAIHPPPHVKFSLESWKTAKAQHVGKTFGVVEIGPHPRTAYRLAQNYIDYPNGVSLRKHEVWLRRGATSDLASPEEIAQLLRKTPTPSVTVEENFTYQRIPEDERELRVFMDLAQFSEELGGSLSYSNITLSLGKQRFVWQVVVTPELTASANIQDAIDRCRLAHGVLIVSLGSISKSALPSYAELAPRESWGCYVRLNLAHRYHERTTLRRKEGMRPLKPFSLPIIALNNVKDSQGLRDKFIEAIRYLNEDPRELHELKISRAIVNQNLQNLLAYGWKEHVETTYGNPVRRLKKHEFVEGDDYRKEIFTAMWRRWEVDHAKRVLVTGGIWPKTPGGKITSDSA